MNHNLMFFKNFSIGKLINKFLSTFKRKSPPLIKSTEILDDCQEDFRNSLKVKSNDDELKILDLQKAYKAGNILEKDMSPEERSKLLELYNKQNNELQEKIKNKEKVLRKKISSST